MMASKHKEEQDERSIAQFFFEKGYGACWADAFMAMPTLSASFPLTDAAVDRAWDVLPMCQDTSEDYVEFDKRKALSDAAPEMLSTLQGIGASMEAILASDLRRAGPAALIPEWLAEIRSAIARATGAA